MNYLGDVKNAIDIFRKSNSNVKNEETSLEDLKEENKLLKQKLNDIRKLIKDLRSKK